MMRHVASSFALAALVIPVASAQAPGPWTPQSLPPLGKFVAGDFDGDGDVDLLSQGDFFENAAGDASAWIVQPGGGTDEVAAGDLDGDGDLDVVTEFHWRENAAGDASAWVVHPIASATLQVTIRHVADIDGDGDLDLLSHQPVFDQFVLSWLENAEGDASEWVERPFHSYESAAPFFFSPGSKRPMSTSDVDGDGDLDVVAEIAGPGTFGPYFLGWWENLDGSGSSWTHHPVAVVEGIGPILCSDLDGDGDEDVVLSAESDGVPPTSTIEVFLNDGGDGTQWTSVSVSAEFYLATCIGDMDRDGDLDLAISEAGFSGNPPAQQSWLENVNGDASVFQRHLLAPLPHPAFGQVEALDLDGDGDLDVLGSSIPQPTWWRNDAPQAPAVFCDLSPIAPLPDAQRVVAADLDGDGDTDIAAGSSTEQDLEWYENLAGDGSSWATMTVGPGVLPAELLAGDVDRDGDQDLIGALSGGGLLAWYENGGGGASWTTRTIESGENFASADAADLDGDGDLDVVASTGLSAPNLRWYENDAGDGSTWSLHAIGPPVVGSIQVSAADVDRDGDLDVVSCLSNGAFTWLENTAGNGSAWTVRPLSEALLGSGILGARVADIDGDGDPDLVTVGFASAPLAWFENPDDAASGWGFHPVPDSGFAALSVDAADVDADGDVDLLASFNGALPAFLEDAWYENLSGDGSAWEEHAFPIQPSSSRHAIFADIDGDADLDLVSAGQPDTGVGWIEHVRLAAVESVRLGTPPNPDALRSGLTSGPAIGATWDPWVDHVVFMPDASFDLLSLAVGPLNVPTQYGTVLCTAPLVTLVGAPGVPFAIPISEDCSLLGIGLCTQAASWNGTLAATNALDIVLGTW